ncbi:MAG: DUF1343 domain-containing protein [bacterium]|nr:DUF1343 domain-containing protein [bacterium]
MRRSTFISASVAAAASAAMQRRRAAAAALPAANLALGDDVFLAREIERLRGRCVGIVTNPTGVTSRLTSVVDAVHRDPRICLRALYAPEHGLRGAAVAGARVASSVDPVTGIPVYSLYGAQRRPSAAMLADVEVLLVDLQDVGDRDYTYVSTLAYVMESAKEHGREVWVLDRPNPLGGATIEGPVLDPRYRSFISLYPMALRHGMTIGELAGMINEHFGIGCALHVVAMDGWRRAMLWPDTGLQWVQTSPNIPTWETCFPFLTTGLLDGIGVFNGVGTTKPFFLAGLPGVSGERLAEDLNARDLPGVYFRPGYWQPFFGRYAKQIVPGVELVIYDYRRYRGVPTSVEIAVALRDLAPHGLRYGSELDRDWGTDAFRRGLQAHHSSAAIIGEWTAATAAFKAAATPFYLYA